MENNAKKPRRVRGSEAANSIESIFRRHVRRKISLRRSVTRALAPTNRRAMEREYFKREPETGSLLICSDCVALDFVRDFVGIERHAHGEVHAFLLRERVEPDEEFLVFFSSLQDRGDDLI